MTPSSRHVPGVPCPVPARPRWPARARAAACGLAAAWALGLWAWPVQARPTVHHFFSMTPSPDAGPKAGPLMVLRAAGSFLYDDDALASGTGADGSALHPGAWRAVEGTVDGRSFTAAMGHATVATQGPPGLQFSAVPVTGFEHDGLMLTGVRLFVATPAARARGAAGAVLPDRLGRTTGWLAFDFAPAGATGAVTASWVFDHTRVRPLPEPGTWLSFAAGLGALGALGLWRRRAAAAARRAG